jgi:hypothetical protein
MVKRWGVALFASPRAVAVTLVYLSGVVIMYLVVDVVLSFHSFTAWGRVVLRGVRVFQNMPSRTPAVCRSAIRRPR